MNRVRMDKWLWAARFFKTRVLAGLSCDMGRIECNGQTAKSSREVRIGDMLLVRNDGNEFELEVLLVNDARGSGAIAQTMYRETEASRAKRQKAAEERKAMQELDGGREAAKPSKRDRRDINRLRGR